MHLSWPRRSRLLLFVLAATPCFTGSGPGLLGEPPAEPVTGFFRRAQFIRGDANTDGVVNITDALYTLNALFLGGPATTCEEAADVNANQEVDISDPVASLGFLFLGSATPAPPGPYECGVALSPSRLGCRSYPLCPDDLPLIAHVLNRITFGPTEELYTRIQTKAELLAYLDDQLDGVPAGYDPAVHEPEMEARIAALEAGAQAQQNARAQLAALKSRLLIYGVESRWQLYHVVTQFWNNHFHTQVDTLAENFFSRAPRGGPALASSPEMFEAVDIDPDDGSITEAEWNGFRFLHPGAVSWDDFARETRNDGLLSQQEFIDHRFVANWKYYRGGIGQVSGEMEIREYDLYRQLAFGSFRSLADACAKSVAMLIYLNGFENTVRAPNENFAREVLELHTVGVDNGYTQRDIEELAKILTGWTAGWTSRSGYSPDDLNFQGHPEAQVFPLDLREPRPFAFPTQQFWEDELYAWAFVARPQAHEWGRKDLFLQRYGGTDSLGSPLPVAAELTIPENLSNRTVPAALSEFDLFMDRLMSFRDVARFISTKLIQLFVTDDLSLLAKDQPIAPDLLKAFQAVDLDADGTIEVEEWEAPVPLILPNGRPPQVFARLDANGDGAVTTREYQEPDLLEESIDTWHRTGGNVREVIRTILHSEEFLSLKFYRAKVKTPLELVTSAMRALAASTSNQHLFLTVEDLMLAGMELYNFADPTGESELGFDWLHTVGLLERLKYLNRAANPGTPQETRFTWNPGDFRARWSLDTPEETIEFFTLLLHAGDILANHRQLALDVYNSAPGNKTLAAVGYMLSLPQFQKQ